jgi:alpha-beta hydrolase superfamily lysophospholipase
VVAHSHGGNVVLYAVRDAEREDAQEALPRGAVCLSTPFIAAQPRPVTLFRFVATYAVILVTLFAVVANAMADCWPPGWAPLTPRTRCSTPWR